MSVYDHPQKIGCQMIKISHGRSKPAKYIPFHGTREDAKALEAEIRETIDRTDPAFADLIPEFKVAYRNRSSKRGGSPGKFFSASDRIFRQISDAAYHPQPDRAVQSQTLRGGSEKADDQH